MSGWQWIGVVISVLWLVGLPLYIITTTNNRANTEYLECYGNAALETNPDQRQGHQNYCAHMRDLSTVKFSKVFFENPDASWV
jgi:hypothetical protein